MSLTHLLQYLSFNAVKKEKQGHPPTKGRTLYLNPQTLFIVRTLHSLNYGTTMTINDQEGLEKTAPTPNTPTENGDRFWKLAANMIKISHISFLEFAQPTGNTKCIPMLVPRKEKWGELVASRLRGTQSTSC